ncbi:MAG: hypothetical protein F4X66_09100 [Chloroflexi bacterium]|nr:hypothetical protein [Chloroflexota bacterium]
MTIPQIRRLVDSLMHKYADEVEAYRLMPVAQQFCEDLARAVTGKKPGRPRSIGEWTRIFLRRAQERRLQLQSLDYLNDYLDRCLDLRVLPQANELLRALLPRAARRGIIPRALEAPIPF